MGESRGRSPRVWGLEQPARTRACVSVCACVRLEAAGAHTCVCVCVCLRTERAGWENNGEPLGTERLDPLPTLRPQARFAFAEKWG